MSNEEKKNIGSDEDINSFLDSLTTDDSSTEDFLSKLYDDSFAEITSDFDTLLKEFQSIDPDDLSAQGETPASAAPAEDKPEIEDIYSYSAPEKEEVQPEKKFSEAVKEAMEAEIAGAESEPQEEGAFHLSLDSLEGEDLGFGEAIREVSAPEKKAPAADGATQVYSTDAVRRAEHKPAAKPAQKPASKQPAKQNKQKKKSRFLPNREDSTFEIFRKVLFLVSMAVVIVCLGIIGNTYLLQPQLEKRRQDKVSELLANGVSDADSFKQAFGDTNLPAGANYNLAQFYAANPDFYGYLEIPGTGISTPVVQGKDNSKYLKRNFFGESTKYGCPFVNYKNTYAALDYNTSIFGHNMEYDDLVFGELEKYRKIDGFKKAPLIHLETMYADYYFKVYAVFLTDSQYDDSGWYFDYIFTQLKDEAECKEYIAELDARKLYSTGVDIQPTDKLLTLSTCAYDFNEERLVVVGRLVREGESTDVDVSRAVASSSPRYPDKYYQKKGLSNPYATASKWIPNA